MVPGLRPLADKNLSKTYSVIVDVKPDLKRRRPYVVRAEVVSGGRTVAADVAGFVNVEPVLAGIKTSHFSANQEPVLVLQELKGSSDVGWSG